MRKRIANLTSDILSPFPVSTAVILLLSFKSTAGTAEAIKWAFVSMVLSVLPVFLIVLYLVRTGRLDAIFTGARRQRTQIYVLAGLSAAVGSVVLYYIKAPPILVAAFIGGLVMAVIFLVINLWWKISLHTALVAASVTVLVILYGWIAAVTVALVPLIAWARIELKHHSLAQAITGALLAALIAAIVLYPFLRA
ncbi:MAG: phosphatidic acid phosphatase [Chloroflexi bacterium]|nr:phosphatidic acid phosphatase [Chloroflexota bacterium]